MSYQPYSKNIIIQEPMDTLEEVVQDYENNKAELNSNYVYLYSEDLAVRKPNAQDISIKDEKQLVINEYLVFTLGILAASTVFVFHVFNK
jgi:hypothetical protein|tara:strand:- start:124 stop:393 length:270 start_codon:yes stop_codon:yes gene_type:complete